MLIRAGRGVLDAVGAGWEGGACRGQIWVRRGYVNICKHHQNACWGCLLLLGTIGGGFRGGKNICRV